MSQKTFNDVLGHLFTLYPQLGEKFNAALVQHTDFKLVHLGVPLPLETLKQVLLQTLTTIQIQPADFAKFITLLLKIQPQERTAPTEVLTYSHAAQKSQQVQFAIAQARTRPASLGKAISKAFQNKQTTTVKPQQQRQQKPKSKKTPLILDAALKDLVTPVLQAGFDKGKPYNTIYTECEATCGICADYYHKAPLSRCKSRHGGTPCNSAGLFPHVRKNDLIASHISGKTTFVPLKNGTYINPLVDNYKMAKYIEAKAKKDGAANTTCRPSSRDYVRLNPLGEDRAPIWALTYEQAREMPKDEMFAIFRAWGDKEPPIYATFVSRSYHGMAMLEQSHGPKTPGGRFPHHGQGPAPKRPRN